MVVYKDWLEEARDRQWPENEKRELEKRNIKIWEKTEWRAEAVDLTKEEWNIFPMEYVTITHTRSRGCHSHLECFQLMQELQRKDIVQNKLLDIKHNYYIGSNLEIYEGRGWLINSSRDPEFAYMDKNSIDIAYIGDFSETPPPEKFYKVAEKVMRFVVGHSVVKDEFKLIPFGQKEPVPGPDVCADIRERYNKYRDDIAPRGELKVEDNILNLW
ncbi:peptidoglycan-recognition protein SD-like [Macrosteles quadrilineatus]|uniref:peptidoglycan-recognition protein SD-like n=1 Tax=Macrosteles quadrilineatus TaxID=74068 RepID=UPI0023E1ADB5|nr:peptidoglycan-recognition protein SD-like [Macrosteles quadrilineatus]